jgi:hypothetical protein
MDRKSSLTLTIGIPILSFWQSALAVFASRPYLALLRRSLIRVSGVPEPFLTLS